MKVAFFMRIEAVYLKTWRWSQDTSFADYTDVYLVCCEWLDIETLTYNN